MGAPFTQVEIQAEIDFYKDAMRTATTSQEYAKREQTGSEIDLRRGKLEEIQSSLEYWIGLMNQYFPSAYTVESQANFIEIGFNNG